MLGSEVKEQNVIRSGLLKAVEVRVERGSVTLLVAAGGLKHT